MSQCASTRYHSGLEAERSVARHYLGKGLKFAKHRYRGQAGEIDLIMKDDERIVFVEVKKSVSHTRAAHALSNAQISRLIASAEEYLGSHAGGLNCEARFDVALVDAYGHVKVIENALSA